MKGISRRAFIKYCIGSAAALGLDATVVGRLQQALAADANPLPAVIWLNGANCTGCTVSLANLVSQESPTDIVDLLVNYIDLAFHPNLMGAAGHLAVQQLNETAGDDFILVMDGGVPTAFDGHTCVLWSENGREVTALEAVGALAPKAAAVLCVGTCACFGGIPAAGPNPTGVKPVPEIAGVATINIPGCPTHPDWIVWTVAQLLAGVVPELDEYSRPRFLFERKIHDRCPRKGMKEVVSFGQEGCLKEMGCKGPRTKADCYSRKWNNGTDWCIGANAICIGCTEDGFPDKFTPFYTRIERSQKVGDVPPDSVSIDSVVYDAAGQALTIVATCLAQPEADLTAEGFGALDWKSWKNFYRNTFTGVASRPASVTVNSSAGGSAAYSFPAQDTVSIDSVVYDAIGQTLTVVATSSAQPEAALSAEGFGALDWKSWKNFYRNTFTGIAAKPDSVAVQSTLGGFDTRNLP